MRRSAVQIRFRAPVLPQPSPNRTRNRMRSVVVPLCVGILGTAVWALGEFALPTANRWLTQARASDTKTIDPSTWRPLSRTTVDLSSPGVARFASPPGEMRWFGGFVHDVGPCAYSLTF